MKPAASIETPKPTPSVSTAAARSLRPRRSSAGIYEISSDSDERSSSQDDVDSEDKAFEDEGEEEVSGESQPREEEEDEEPEVEKPERGSEAGRSLRPRRSLAAPPGLADYVDTNKALSHRRRSTKKKKPEVKKRAVGRLQPGKACKPCRDSRRRCDRVKPRCSGCVKAGKQCVVPDANDPDQDDQWENELDDEPEYSVRSEIRKTLDETKKKRDAFFIEYKSLFEPLLPEKNYISKMVERNEAGAVRKQEVDVVMEDVSADQIKPEAEDAKTNGDIKLEATSVEVKLEELEVRDAVKAEDKDSAVKANVCLTESIPRVASYELLEKQPEQYAARQTIQNHV